MVRKKWPDPQALLGSPLAIYRGLSGPPGPSPKGLKKVSRGLRPQSPRECGKSLEKSQESGESLEELPQRLFPEFSILSGGPGAGGFLRLFQTFFRLFQFFPEGPRDPCEWPAVLTPKL